MHGWSDKENQAPKNGHSCLMHSNRNLFENPETYRQDYATSNHYCSGMGKMVWVSSFDTTMSISERGHKVNLIVNYQEGYMRCLCIPIPFTHWHFYTCRSLPKPFSYSHHRLWHMLPQWKLCMFHNSTGSRGDSYLYWMYCRLPMFLIYHMVAEMRGQEVVWICPQVCGEKPA